MKRFFAILLTLALLLSALPFASVAGNAAAELQASKKIGDVNEDDTINAKDVTVLRRYLAGGYGVELGTVNDGLISVTYTDAVTGGQIYQDLGEPQLSGYTMNVLVDGKIDETYSDSFPAMIRSGDTDEVTPVGSFTEASLDPDSKTVTISISRYYIAQIDGVFPAQTGTDGQVTREGYVTLKRADWTAVPNGKVTFKDGTKRAQVFITDEFTDADVNAYVAYTKANDLVQTLTRAEMRSGESGTFIGTADGRLTSFDLDGTSYKVAATTPAFGTDYSTAATVYPDPNDTNPTICLDPNGNVLHVVVAPNNAGECSAMFLAAAKADAAKGDPRTMPVYVPESIKLLVIGNSFGNDCSIDFLYSMFKSAGVKNVTIGILYYSGCRYDQHINFALTDQTVYKYHKYANTATLVSTEKYTFDRAIADEDWDHIMMLSGFTCNPSEFGPPAWQDLMLCYVRNRCPDAFYGYDMTWPFHEDFEEKTSAAAELFRDLHNGDQMTMYNHIISATQQHVVPEQRFKFIVPVGTAIQNARTSFIGDHLDRDGYHLNKGIGRYIATLTVCCTLTGCSPEQITVQNDAALLKEIPAGLSKDMPGIKDQLVRVAHESVKNALANPYEITQSKITTPQSSATSGLKPNETPRIPIH